MSILNSELLMIDFFHARAFLLLSLDVKEAGKREKTRFKYFSHIFALGTNADISRCKVVQ